MVVLSNSCMLLPISLNFIAHLVLFLAETLVYAQGYAVVANNDVAASSVSKDDLKSMFTKNNPKLGSDSVKIIAPTKDSAAGKAFYDDVFGGYKNYVKVWIPRELSGDAQKPEEMASSAVAGKVAGQSKAVGIVAPADASGNVKKIAVK